MLPETVHNTPLTRFDVLAEFLDVVGASLMGVLQFLFRFRHPRLTGGREFFFMFFETPNQPSAAGLDVLAERGNVISTWSTLPLGIDIRASKQDSDTRNDQPECQIIFPI